MSENNAVQLGNLSLLTQWAKPDASARAKEAGVSVNQFYLRDSLGCTALGAEPRVVFLAPTVARQWVKLDRNGDVTEAVPESQLARDEARELGYVEQVSGGCVVLLGTGEATACYPARFELKKGATRCWRDIERAIGSAAAPAAALALRGAAGAAAGRLPDRLHWLRVVSTMTAKPEKGDGGNEYIVVTARSRLCNDAEATALLDFAETLLAGTIDAADRIHAAIDRRLNALPAAQA